MKKEMRIIRKSCAVILCLLSLGIENPGIAFCAPGDAAQILSFGSSARDVSMGGAASAIPQGVNSLYWNPSLLGEVTRRDAGFLQAQLFSKTTLNWLGYAYPFTQSAGTLGFQFMQMKTAAGNRTDAFNEIQGSFSSLQQDFGFGYGFRPANSEKLYLGVGVNALQRKLDTASNTLYGLSLGSHYSFLPNLKTGFVLENILRGKIGDTDDALPMNLKLGNAYTIFNGFLVTADLKVSNLKTPSFNFGTEYSWRVISLRAGRSPSGDLALGFGLNWKLLRLDFAMSSNSDLGASQMVSFGLTFGKDMSKFRKVQAQSRFQDGVALYENGDWLGAQSILDRALKSDPTNAMIDMQLNRLSSFIKALNLPSDKRVARAAHKEFLGEGDAGRLIQDGAILYVQGNESSADLLFHQALNYRGQDKRLEDVTAFIEKTAHIKSPAEGAVSPQELVNLKLKRVEDHFALGNYEEALKICQDVIQLAPEMALPRVRLGSIYYAMGDQIRARKEYQKALELDPKNETVRAFMRLQGWIQ